MSQLVQFVPRLVHVRVQRGRGKVATVFLLLDRQAAWCVGPPSTEGTEELAPTRQEAVKARTREKPGEEGGSAGAADEEERDAHTTRAHTHCQAATLGRGPRPVVGSKPGEGESKALIHSLGGRPRKEN